LLLPSIALAQATAPPSAGVAEMERVIVTGSVDGKRVALGSLNPVGFSGGVDINLLPFPMIDHIDILKDGASAVYGSDAITGVVNFFLIHKFPTQKTSQQQSSLKKERDNHESAKSV
jgi:outer membrane cobalamin receptor